MAEDPLLEAALRVADGRPVDWVADARLENEGDIGAWQQLRAIERLAQVQQDDIDEDQEGNRVQDPPFTWGHLEVLGRIGRGSFGDVYSARDPGLDRPVALKLSSSIYEGEAAHSPIVQEGALLARVRHPNVVTVHGAARIGGRSGIWMEFVEGETLERELRAGPLPIDEVVRIGIDLCGALDAVHAAGLLHRDVKAQNVMRDRTGRVVLMDFGAGHEASDATAYERVAGTPTYLAPELLDGGHPGPSTDIYALGVLLFRLASGRFPVTGGTVTDLRRAHQAGPPASLRRVRPDIPPSVAAVIDRAIHPDPSARFGTAGAFHRALLDARAGHSSARHRTYAPFAALALVVVGGIWVTYLAGGTAGGGVTSSAGTQLRTVWADPASPGVHLGSASDDGRFVSALGNDRSILIHDLETGRTSRLIDGDLSQGPEFSVLSRDGRAAAITWGRRGVYDLRIVDRDSPSESRILVPADPAAFDYVVPYDWSPDGRTILAGFRKDLQLDLAAVDVDRGSITVMHRAYWTPSVRAVFSRTGERVALSAPSSERAQHDLLVVDRHHRPGDGPLVRLDGPADDIVAGWSPDDRQLLFLSDRGGTTGLWMLKPEPDRFLDPVPVRQDLRGLPIRVASSGDLLLAVPVSDRGVYAAAVDFDSGRVVSPPQRAVLRQDGVISGPAFSPDGRQLAYTLRRAGDPGDLELVVASADTPHARSIPLPMMAFLHLTWAPDGASILGVGNRGPSGSGVYQVTLPVGEAVLLAADAEFPQFAPAMDKLYFRRPIGRAPFEYVERTVVSGSERVVLRHHAAMVPALSPDGRFVAAVLAQGPESSPRVRRLVVRAVDGSDTREVYQSAQMTFLVRWTPDGSSLVICDGERILVVPLSGGAPRALELSISPPPQREEHLALHPDGRRLAFLAGHARMELWRLERYLPGRE